MKIVLPQDQDTEITTCRESNREIRYAYARSYESRASGEKGQDSLTLQMGEEGLCFALCDGVSMSFMGDLAASLLCARLLDWLSGLSRDGLAGNGTAGALTTFLSDLTGPATQEVSAYRLPDALAPVVVSVLEQKRRLGSESMFVCGRLDFQADQILLGWLGDSRLRIWEKDIEQTEQAFGPTFCTKERWSSRQGCIGQVHTWQAALGTVTRLVAYSDGLAILDGKMDRMYAIPALKQIMRKVDDQPNSDDISYLEITLNSQAMKL